MSIAQNAASLMVWVGAVSLFSPSLVASTSQDADTPNPQGVLEVGRLAPSHGLRSWIQREEGTPLHLNALRGQVVVLHTFAWNCSGCLRVGIPLAVDLQEANRDRGLTVLSCTTPAKREETLEVMEAHGVEHSVAIANPFGGASPYIDASKNSITYMFVIDRDGALAWRGDPSRDEEECLEAIGEALARAAGPGLEGAQHPELLGALRHYQARRFFEARKDAQARRERHAKKSAESSVAIVAAADALLAILDQRESEALQALEAPGPDGEALAWVRAWKLAIRFRPKGQGRRELDKLRRATESGAPGGAALELAFAWDALASERPILFPTREDRTSKRFLRDLRDHIEKHPESPGGGLAGDWLAAWQQARDRD